MLPPRRKFLRTEGIKLIESQFFWVVTRGLLHRFFSLRRSILCFFFSLDLSRDSFGRCLLFARLSVQSALHQLLANLSCLLLLLPVLVASRLPLKWPELKCGFGFNQPCYSEEYGNRKKKFHRNWAYFRQRRSWKSKISSKISAQQLRTAVTAHCKNYLFFIHTL